MKTQALTLVQALAAARETRRLEVGRDILEKVPALFRDVCPGRTAILVADANTMTAAGTRVAQALAASGVRTLPAHVFNDPGLYAEFRFVEELESVLKQGDAVPIAVGSGTLNDLTKLAAHRTGRPSLCVATAASMDGYTAFGSSITHLGSKQTFDCPAPVAVLADLEVIAAAPAVMNGWGYADLFAKVTAGADWIVADALGVEPIDPQAWNIVQGGLPDALRDPEGVSVGNSEAIGRLVEGLMLGGFAMQATKSSRPASGAEHQFSHLWDMQHHTHEGLAPSHGAKVGIATLAVTALYEELFKVPLEAVEITRCCDAWPEKEEWLQLAERQFDDPELKAVAVREITAKHSTRDELLAQLRCLKEIWPGLLEKVRSQLVPFDELKRRLGAAGAVTEPEQIGISRRRLKASFRSAFFIRRRFTVLDLALRTGLLDQCLEKVFGPDGRWPQ